MDLTRQRNENNCVFVFWQSGTGEICGWFLACSRLFDHLSLAVNHCGVEASELPSFDTAKEVGPHCNGQLQCTLSNYGDDGLSEHVPSALTLAMDVINRSINRSVLGRPYSKYLQMLGQ